jgi:ABC-type transport system involved in multi-copper enzyme maturation permease subunit
MDGYTPYWVFISGMAVAGLVLLITGVFLSARGRKWAVWLIILAGILLLLALGCGGIIHDCQAGSPGCH